MTFVEPMPFIILWDLKLSDCELDDAVLEPIGNLAGLKYLAVPKTKVTDAGLVHLRQALSLMGLDLSRTQIRGWGLRYLEGLSNLESLNLAGSALVDANLADVKWPHHLAALDLEQTRIDDKTLKRLSADPGGVGLHFSTFLARGLQIMQ